MVEWPEVMPRLESHPDQSQSDRSLVLEQLLVLVESLFGEIEYAAVGLGSSHLTFGLVG